MEQKLHLMLQPRLDLGLSRHILTREDLGLDDAAVRGDGAKTLKRCIGHLEILWLKQPVGTDYGLVKNAGAGNGHIASRFGGREDGTERKNVRICRDPGGRETSQEGDRSAFKR